MNQSVGLYDIFRGIAQNWKAGQRQQLWEALNASAEGAATGTEGLCNTLGYLADLATRDQEAIMMVRNELAVLIDYCEAHGIIVDARFRKCVADANSRT